MRRVDLHSKTFPLTSLNFHIDDCTIDTLSTSSVGAIAALKDSAQALAVVIEDELFLPLADSKANMIGSDQEAVVEAAKELGRLGDTPQTTVRNLGVGNLGGKRPKGPGDFKVWNARGLSFAQRLKI